MRRSSLLVLAFAAALTAVPACGDDDEGDTDSEGGSGGEPGSTGGKSTTGGTRATGGSTGSAGEGGDPGTAGDTGTSGDTGTGGDTGTSGATGTGGEVGASGDTGTGGDTGASGATGTGGSGEAGAPASGAGGDAGSGNGGPVLLSDPDFPADDPCPNQALLTDAAAFADLKTALMDGAITYLDVPYDAADAEIYDKKCGRPGAFDPAIYTDLIPVVGGDPDLSDIVDTQNGGICSDGFATFGADEGFPTAGTYRKGFRTAYMSTTYELRVRIEASGSSAGNTFADESVAPGGTADLVYVVDGGEVAEDALWDGLIDAMEAPPGGLPSVDLVVENAGGDQMFYATIELICAAEL